MSSENPVNPPKATLSETAKAYRYKSTRFTVGAGNDRIFYIPYKVQHHPTAVQLSSNTTITMEGTCASNDILNGDVEGQTANWFPITVSGKLVTIDYPLTAIKVINGAGAPITVDVI